MNRPPPKNKSPDGGNRQGLKEVKHPLIKESNMSDDIKRDSKNPVIVSIGDKQVSIVEYKGQRVVTLAMIDELHERPKGTASRNFQDNRDRFVEGEDFYLIEFVQNNEFRGFGIEVPPRGLTLLSETGYLMLVKSFTDDLAWTVQRTLVKEYFRAKEKAGVSSTDTRKPTLSTPKEARLMFNLARSIGKMVGLEGNELAIRANRVTKKNTGIDFLEDMGVAAIGTPSPVNDTYLTPTDIGRVLGGLSGIAVNKKLEADGYQIRVEGQWTPTEKGKLAGGRFFDRERSNGTGSAQQLKWPSNMVKVLRSLPAMEAAL